ncbi:flagellar biosynthesis regulator FlhF [Pseudoruegeria sp. SK021]|nr:flagellar biosynthesis regulator FlhF [Pseudoruegeria sp. SK021]
MARTAYSPATSAVRTPQSIEYAAFARVTRDLKGAEDHAALVRPLHDNRRLWTVLASSVADGDNALPTTLRAQIFYLAEFTVHYTRRILQDKADPAVLIDINAAVMRGLREQGQAT